MRTYAQSYLHPRLLQKHFAGKRIGRGSTADLTLTSSHGVRRHILPSYPSFRHRSRRPRLLPNMQAGKRMGHSSTAGHCGSGLTLISSHGVRRHSHLRPILPHAACSVCGRWRWGSSPLRTPAGTQAAIRLTALHMAHRHTGTQAAIARGGLHQAHRQPSHSGTSTLAAIAHRSLHTSCHHTQGPAHPW